MRFLDALFGPLPKNPYFEYSFKRDRLVVANNALSRIPEWDPDWTEEQKKGWNEAMAEVAKVVAAVNK